VKTLALLAAAAAAPITSSGFAGAEDPLFENGADAAGNLGPHSNGACANTLLF
jgi:hypothetical protein